jgi:hypothetical protein
MTWSITVRRIALILLPAAIFIWILLIAATIFAISVRSLGSGLSRLWNKKPIHLVAKYNQYGYNCPRARGATIPGARAPESSKPAALDNSPITAAFAGEFPEIGFGSDVTDGLVMQAGGDEEQDPQMGFMSDRNRLQAAQLNRVLKSA